MLHLDRIRFEEYFTGTTLRAHLCTLTIALSFNNVIRLPRESIHYGIIPYLLVFLFVSIILALPCALQQITVGQFQQDVVGAWRAVPFFKAKRAGDQLVTIYSATNILIAVVMTHIRHIRLPSRAREVEVFVTRAWSHRRAGMSS
ncbi:hypothetical protein EVAR_69401_1 [Eumeta japonica]|uniref:Uncharacterized protein n=1 Tax=Eumeta variegata TaxID=151549 RepID=A0A4C2A1U3_EUMVA|nr:hypothetical protein EVAR_69401_1 [Eumeta japonica]